MVSTKVVSPENVDVLNSDGNEVLTLVTCYPFYFLRLRSRPVYRAGSPHYLTRVGSMLDSTSEADDTIRSIKPVFERLGRLQNVVTFDVALDAFNRLAVAIAHRSFTSPPGGHPRARGRTRSECAQDRAARGAVEEHPGNIHKFVTTRLADLLGMLNVDTTRAR